MFDEHMNRHKAHHTHTHTQQQQQQHAPLYNLRGLVTTVWYMHCIRNEIAEARVLSLRGIKGPVAVVIFIIVVVVVVVVVHVLLYDAFWHMEKQKTHTHTQSRVLPNNIRCRASRFDIVLCCTILESNGKQSFVRLHNVCFIRCSIFSPSMNWYKHSLV